MNIYIDHNKRSVRYRKSRSSTYKPFRVTTNDYRTEFFTSLEQASAYLASNNGGFVEKGRQFWEVKASGGAVEIRAGEVKNEHTDLPQIEIDKGELTGKV